MSSLSRQLTYNGRTYRVCIPSFEERAYSFAFCLHGGGGSGFTLSAGMDINDTLGGDTIIVYPTATVNQDGFTSWNPGGPFNPTADDVTYFNDILSVMIATGRVDIERMYLFGESEGGMMGYRLICEQPTKWQGLYSMAANLVPDISNPDTFTGKLRETHGTDDTHVPILGGIGPDSFYPVNWPSSYVTIPSFTKVQNPGIDNLNPLVGYGHALSEIKAGLISQGTTLQIQVRDFIYN